MYLSKKIVCLIILIAIAEGACHTHQSIIANSKTERIHSSKIKNKYAELLQVNEKQINNIKLYTFIDEWYGVPYKYGGKNKQGIDCSAYTAMLYKEVYGKVLVGSALSVFKDCEMVSLNNIREGDLVFFKIDGDKISHIGTYLQNNKFVHASTKKGIMIDDLNEPYYKKYFYKAGRLK